MSALTRARLRAQPEWLIGVGTLALTVFYYAMRADTVGVFSPERGWHSLTPAPLPIPLHYVMAALLLGLVPVLAARVFAGLKPAQLGLGLGDWRAGLRWLLVGIPLAVVAGRIGAAGGNMNSVYPLDASVTADAAAFAPYALLQFFYYAAWEVLFRGVLLFGLRDRLGAAPANFAQTALSVTAHFGRAASETLAALPAGLVFGCIALRARSIWCIAVVHWIVGVSCDWFILQS